MRAVKDLRMYIDNQIIYTGNLNDPEENILNSFEFHPNIQKMNKNIKINSIKKLQKHKIGLTNEGKVIQ